MRSRKKWQSPRASALIPPESYTYEATSAPKVTSFVSRILMKLVPSYVFKVFEIPTSSYASAHRVPQLVVRNYVLYRRTWLFLVPRPILFLACRLQCKYKMEYYSDPRALTEQYMVYLHPLHAFNNFLSSSFFHGFIHRGFAQYALSCPTSRFTCSFIWARTASSLPAMQSRTEW